MARVDVIIPFYNTPIDMVTKALESVRAQSVTDWKAIVVNDGSREPSTHELEALIGRLNDPRITHLRIENSGPSAARNAGIRASSSPFFALLDSDDVWYPNRLAVGLAALEADPTLDLVHANCDLLAPDGQITLARPRRFDLNAMSREEQFATLLKSNFVSVVTVMMRRGAGLFDEGLRSVEDKELWLRLMLEGRRFLHQDETVALYRLHAENTSKRASHMAQGRARLIAKLDWMVAEHRLLTPGQWQRLRRYMRHHMYQELAETWLENKQPWKAFWFSLPPYSGASAEAAKLSLRALVHCARALAGRGQRPSALAVLA